MFVGQSPLLTVRFSGMSAVIGGTFGDAAENKESRVCLSEYNQGMCIDVASAAGIGLSLFRVRTLSNFFIIKATESRRRFPFALIPICIKSTDFSSRHASGS